MGQGGLVRLAFTTNGNTAEDPIEPTFGRCRNFLVVDTGTGEVTVVPNPGGAAGGGAGVKAAETLAELKIDTLITGNVGLNARPLLQAAGISIVAGRSGSIRAYLSAAGGSSENYRSGAADIDRQRGDIPERQRRHPAGLCCCDRCGYRVDDDSGAPCYKLRCPNCGGGMERRFT
jgi:predicted Fe-Mo cluster-binding NifX family protein